MHYFSNLKILTFPQRPKNRITVTRTRQLYHKLLRHFAQKVSIYILPEKRLLLRYHHVILGILIYASRYHPDVHRLV